MEDDRNSRSGFAQFLYDAENPKRKSARRPSQSRVLQEHPLTTPPSRLFPKAAQRRDPSTFGPRHPHQLHRKAAVAQRAAQTAAILLDGVGWLIPPPQPRADAELVHSRALTFRPKSFRSAAHPFPN